MREVTRKNNILGFGGSVQVLVLPVIQSHTVIQT